MENITFFYMDAQNYVVVRYICFLDSQFGYGTLKFWHADLRILARGPMHAFTRRNCFYSKKFGFGFI
jgi:hypothetical protein